MAATCDNCVKRELTRGGNESCPFLRISRADFETGFRRCPHFKLGDKRQPRAPGEQSKGLF